MKRFATLLTLALCTVAPRLAAQPAATVIQELPPQTAKAVPERLPVVASISALMVEVTVARYQGDKQISSLPYMLSVTPDESVTSLRVGGDMAIPSIVVKAGDAGDAKAAQSGGYSYRSIGTSLDVRASPAITSASTTAPTEGRYRLSISVEETSVYPTNEAAKNNMFVSNAPAFRSFRATNRVVLRNNQSLTYTAATDRITGETTRISVKLTVIN